MTAPALPQPTVIRAADLTLAEVVRFHRRIVRSNDCWIWTGSKNNNGYGRFEVYRNGARVRMLAHRLAYELVRGESSQPVLRHDCDAPLCCNPGHLTPGTQKENMRDASVRGRLNYAGLRAGWDRHNARIQERLAIGAKKCSVCRITRPFVDFSYSSRLPDGRADRCRECRSALYPRGGLSVEQRAQIRSSLREAS